jgi:catechol 2,3-dioxygenase-like lactoylglutathione lyase family enzyme
MKLLQIRLLTEDFKKSAAFYRDVLAFPVSWYEESMEYALFNNGETRIELLSQKSFNEAIGNKSDSAAGAPAKFVLSFEVENVDASYADLLEKGVIFLKEPEDKESWNARVAHFRDPDGNLIEIYRSL